MALVEVTLFERSQEPEAVKPPLAHPYASTRVSSVHPRILSPPAYPSNVQVMLSDALQPMLETVVVMKDEWIFVLEKVWGQVQQSEVEPRTARQFFAMDNCDG